MAKMNLDGVRTRASTVDRARLDATTEADIRRHKAEDGDADRPAPADARVVLPPKALRIRLALTQQEMADALRIPVGTWRNWEQGRVALDPAARSLLAVVQASPEMALAALRSNADVSNATPRCSCGSMELTRSPSAPMCRDSPQRSNILPLRCRSSTTT